MVIAGDPISVKDQIYKFVEKTGNFGTLLYVGVDWLDKSLAKNLWNLWLTKLFTTCPFNIIF